MFNVKPSKPDSRDRAFQLREMQVKQMVDLRQPDVIIEDQDQLGSCTSNAIVGAYEIMLKKKYPERYDELSRLFLYYNMRLFYDELEKDSGGYLRDGLKALKRYGICAESFWPYDISKFDVQPPPKSYVDATRRNINYYETTITHAETMQVLSLEKPVVIAAKIFRSFDYLNSMNFVVPMPAESENSIGGHALCIVGYNLNQRQYIVKNSFGIGWGDNGYCLMPFEYVDKYVFEKWYFDITDQSTILI